MPGNSKEQVCVICGVNPATTRDHIPPKGVFATPRPSDLITVPTCNTCNSGTSTEDEAFRVYLNIHAGLENKATEELWQKDVVRSFRHNKRLGAQIISAMKPAVLSMKSSLILKPVMVGRWDGEVFQKTFEKIIRGLYFHHFNRVLGNKVPVEVFGMETLPDEMLSLSESWAYNQVGNGKFCYRYAMDELQPLDTCWIFEFYGSLWASGCTKSIDENIDNI